MTEDIKSLIEKIQEEGVKVAEDKAKVIEEQAKKQAQDIMEKARKEAGRLLAEATDKMSQMQTSTKLSLQQAGRDLLLALKKEINALLDKVILASVHQALEPDELAKMISALIRDSHAKEKVIISLKKEDAEKLEKAYLNKLKDELKKEIILKPSADILGGFMISYDSGKSYFDFTDKALVEYLGAYVRPKLAQILNEAATNE